MKDRIKNIRRKFNLTQQEFAEKIGIKRGAIANYELGRNEPIDAVISLICREFNVNEEWLRSGHGEMFLPPETDILDQLAKKYKLTRADCIFVEKFVSLCSDARSAILDFIHDVDKTITENEETFSDSMDMSVEAYYKKLPKTPEELEAKYPLEEIGNKSEGIG